MKIDSSLTTILSRSLTVSLVALLLTACGGSHRSDAIRETGSSAQNSGTTTQNTGTTSAQSAGGSSATGTPELDFSAQDDGLQVGATTVLRWTATGADSCAASGAWSGSRPLQGSETVGPITDDATFTLTCRGPGGSVMSMISVGVLGSVTLSWQAPAENVDGTPLTDLAGYEIYYGQESRNYYDSVYVDGRSTTSKTLQLPPGSYYFAMTAWDVEGNESAYSNEVIKTVN
jgi:hypothetical protein